MIETPLETLEVRLSPKTVAVIDRLPAAIAVFLRVATPSLIAAVPRMRLLSLKETLPSKSGETMIGVEIVAVRVTGCRQTVQSVDTVSFAVGAGAAPTLTSTGSVVEPRK